MGKKRKNPVQPVRTILWTEEMDRMLGTCRDLDVAAKYGISPYAVASRRRKLGIKNKRSEVATSLPEWTDEWDALLGTMTDVALAERMGIRPALVGERRKELGIPVYQPPPAPEPEAWDNSKKTLTAAQKRKLGTVSDATLGQRWGMSPQVVARFRQELGIPPVQEGGEVEWTSGMLSLLGEVPDRRIADEYEVSHLAVKIKRIEMGIRPWGKDHMDPEPDLPAHVIAQIGKIPDKHIADKFRVGRNKIRIYRALHKIPKVDYRAPPAHEWTDDEIALLGTMSDSDVARRIKIPTMQVAHRRRVLGIPAFRRAGTIRWTKARIEQLGNQPDQVLANAWGCAKAVVTAKREELGIALCEATSRVWTQEELDLLGKLSDVDVGKRLGISASAVASKRKEVGIAPHGKPKQFKSGRYEWKDADLKRLGTMPDHELALKLGLSHQFVRDKRVQLGIPRYRRSEERWTAEIIEMMGVISDADIAKKLGVSHSLVSMKRRELGLPSINETGNYRNR